MYFHNTIFTDNRPVYSALITPVIHYCMGGLLVDEHARVKDKQGNIISNLYACGEATGRVHGANRLGGSSLLEVRVYDSHTLLPTYADQCFSLQVCRLRATGRRVSYQVAFSSVKVCL